MSEKLSLKNILLKKLDRILNPNFSKKYIWALFVIGSSMVGIPAIGFIAEFVVKWRDIEISVSFIDQPVSYISIFLGAVIVFASVYLFHSSSVLLQTPLNEEIDSTEDPTVPYLFYDHLLHNDPNGLLENFPNDHQIIQVDYSNPERTCNKKLVAISGGYNDNPMWGEYLSRFKNKYLEPYLIRIREAIISNRLNNLSGREANDLLFVFNDGVMINFSIRAWGDFIQAMQYSRDGYLKHF